MNIFYRLSMNTSFILYLLIIIFVFLFLVLISYSIINEYTIRIGVKSNYSNTNLKMLTLFFIKCYLSSEMCGGKAFMIIYNTGEGCNYWSDNEPIHSSVKFAVIISSRVGIQYCKLFTKTIDV